MRKSSKQVDSELYTTKEVPIFIRENTFVMESSYCFMYEINFLFVSFIGNIKQNIIYPTNVPVQVYSEV